MSEELIQQLQEASAHCEGGDSYNSRLMRKAALEINKLRTQLASTGGEAVAWGVPDTTPGEHRPFLLLVHHPSQVADPKDLVPLYTHPQPAPAGVVVPRELLSLAVSLPSKESAEANHAGIVTRGAAQAALRAILNQAGGE